MIEKAENTFYLLNFDQGEPIKKEDFAEITKGCNLIPNSSDAAISDLFHELDKDRDNLVSLADFVANCGAENSLPKYKQFLESIEAKESEILKFKLNKQKEQIKGKKKGLNVSD